jgi:hypothetical protein
MKYVLGGLLFLLVLIGGGVGFYLSQQNQDLRQQASVVHSLPNGAVCTANNECSSSLCYTGKCTACVPNGGAAPSQDKCCSQKWDSTSAVCIDTDYIYQGGCVKIGDCVSGKSCQVVAGSNNRVVAPGNLACGANVCKTDADCTGDEFRSCDRESGKCYREAGFYIGK